MPVEFLGIGGTDDGSETSPCSGPSFDKQYTLRRALKTSATLDQKHHAFTVIPLVREGVAGRDRDRAAVPGSVGS
ncbi:hypothetical protein [Sphaerisporangium corydalis]|uniref:Uncharacterized protein n=1 Tax=Sphaerisporangium corydalis TaxID=1441875 RepID=A0ABV9ECY0_9ACTN|nr:hypothetical protein [Sphaerisporangium corydalis]